MPRRHSSIRTVSISLVVFCAAFLGFSPASAGTRCNARKGTCPSTSDTTPPSVSIASPAAGATVSGSTTITGSASDNASIARVDVKVDAGAYSTASGTTAWSFPWNTGSASDGNHTITSRATDAAGNATTTSRVVSVSNAPPSGGASSPTAITDPSFGTDLVLLGRGRMANAESVSALLYTPRLSFSPHAYFRDAQSGATSRVSLPLGQTSGPSWSNATYTLNGLGELWVFSGGGPVYARRYTLSGSGLPTSATLASITSFGNADSRAESMIVLASGGLVGVWHQQGNAGPQGQGIAYRSPAGTWSSVYPLTFMPTKASTQAVAQHPADGSIWVFCDADGWGQIGAAHLTETPSGLTIDWTNGGFITPDNDGDFGPDPENPDLQATVDPSTGSIALAYESSVRQIFSTSPFVAGSYPAVARIAADGSKSFISMPTYVERVSRLGLTVLPGETWLSYRPIQADLTSNDLYVSVFRNGSWSPGQRLGTLLDVTTSGFGAGRAEHAGRMTDGSLWFFPA